MRGKQEFPSASCVLRRITPADAGKTLVFLNFCRNLEDHPRGCGENRTSTLSEPATAGSPPRMRGKPCLPFLSLAQLRITPADAGKTYREMREKISQQDHPRGCGENLKARSQSWSGRGSPPRMRGKPFQNTLQACPRRITPADAGKTHAPRPISATPQDHPRGCGENVNKFSADFKNIGSPPRMRGKPLQRIKQRVPTRITPADAGKTRVYCRVRVAV